MISQPLSEEQLNDLGEEFVERLRGGERPSISEFLRRHPGQEATVAEFLESLAMLEDLKSDEQTSTGSKPLPKQFGRYRIEKTLGEGGMGAVYLAHDSQLERKVALKTPKFAQGSDERLVRRFYREARSAATLSHPNICPVYDVGEIDGIHYITMAYIQGHPLSAYINSKRQPSVQNAVRVLRKITLALQEAHAHGILHRDLKPANIMIDRRNEPIVMDFGLAGPIEQDGDSRLTQAGSIMGSPSYMSPEQLEGIPEKVGPASDVYSLGVLLYELLTGELPYKGTGSVLSIITEVVSKELPNPSTVRSAVDANLAAICRKAMAKDVADRFGSMQEFSEALTSYIKSDTASLTKYAGAEVSDKSADVVRAKEQCELVHSLCKEGQYTAALSILEKMAAADDAHASQFTEWARGELPKVKAKANDDTSNDPLTDDEFWNQEFVATATATTLATSGLTAAPTPKVSKKASIPRWFFWLLPVTTVAVISLVVLIIVENSNDNRGPPLVGPAKRLMEYDVNRDRKLSREELRGVPIARDFDFYDENDDGFLDENELKAIQPPPGDRRGRGGPGGVRGGLGGGGGGIGGSGGGRGGRGSRGGQGGGAGGRGGQGGG
ncbi:MAG: serine/threonine protein kinase, partial [Planctomycetes bacterium]|nr:serine/threonine protein kinase [Planctomycetota bacterium]